MGMIDEEKALLPAQSVHIPALDGVRVLAIIPVFLVHIGVAQGGNLGVALFFVLSGFLIGSLLLGERLETGTIALRPFYVRRVARLYPALLLSMGFAFVISLAIKESSPRAILVAILLSLTYTGNIFSTFTGIWLPLVNFTWTLGQEEQFYLVAPWLIKRLRSDGIAKWSAILFGIAGIVAIVRLVLVLIFPDTWHSIYVNPFLNADGMLAGVALAFALKSNSARMNRVLRRSSAITIASLAALVFGALVLFSNYATVQNEIATPLAIAASMIVICHFVLWPRTWLTRLFELKVLRWIGQRTYGLYLFHYPVFVILNVASPGPVGQRMVRITIALAVTFVIAAGSYKFVERPASRWIRQFQGSRSVGQFGR